MPLDASEGKMALQFMTSWYNQREWRKKIEKTLSLPPSGFEDEHQRKIFLYLKVGLQAYKSRRADSHSWIVGGFATKEVIDRVCFRPSVVDPTMTKDQVEWLGSDPGEMVDQEWWEDMLVKWFEEPEEESDVSASEEEQSEERANQAEASEKESNP